MIVFDFSKISFLSGLLKYVHKSLIKIFLCFFMVIMGFTLPIFAQAKSASSSYDKSSSDASAVATMITSMGTMKIKLYSDLAPITVSNFIELSQKGFYNGLIFHRVIDNFMIQGGDPNGDGTGGAGYSFQDEFNSKLKHSKIGILSMANSGPNTNSSQFFITLTATPHLDNVHSVFGEVVDGLDVLKKIGKVKTAANDRPQKDVKIESVKIDLKGFVPEEVKKVKPLKDEQVQAITKKAASSIAASICAVKDASVPDFGAFKSVEYKKHVVNNNTVTVEYKASCTKKDILLLLRGDYYYKEKKFMLESFKTLFVDK